MIYLCLFCHPSFQLFQILFSFHLPFQASQHLFISSFFFAFFFFLLCKTGITLLINCQSSWNQLLPRFLEIIFVIIISIKDQVKLVLSEPYSLCFPLHSFHHVSISLHIHHHQHESVLLFHFSQTRKLKIFFLFKTLARSIISNVFS